MNYGRVLASRTICVLTCLLMHVCVYLHIFCKNMYGICPILYNFPPIHLLCISYISKVKDLKCYWSI